jgi:hypothetical protein
MWDKEPKMVDELKSWNVNYLQLPQVLRPRVPKGRKRLLPLPFVSRLLATKANAVGGAGQDQWEIYCGASAPLFLLVNGKR